MAGASSKNGSFCGMAGMAGGEGLTAVLSCCVAMLQNTNDPQQSQANAILKFLPFMIGEYADVFISCTAAPAL